MNATETGHRHARPARSRMARVLSMAIPGMVLFLAGCSTVQVSQDYRAGLDFAGYHTYNWQAPETEPPKTGNVLLDNPLLHERFHQAIDRVMALRGYPRQESADFRVSYTFSTETRIESYPYGSHAGIGFGRWHRYGALDFGEYVDIEQYTVGILAINFADAASGKVIWRGLGSAKMDMHATPAETTAFVDKLVDAVLAQFPPQAKGGGLK